MSSIVPILTFKAGLCDINGESKPWKVKAQPTPGYIYLYSEDELVHFCWRPRSAPLDEPELDLVMIPTDGNFVPLNTINPTESSAKTNGRIFVLKFQSSSQRHIFWLQSKPQGRSGNSAWLSPRDKKIGEIVDALLQGEEVDVNAELATVRNNNDDSTPDEDETMEDAEGQGDGQNQGGAGGAGADATGGDVREEGAGSRAGGADGARAVSASTPDAAAAVRNFLNSLQGGQGMGGGQQAEGKLYPLLSDLLEAPITVPMVDAADEAQVNNLLDFLPPSLLVLAQQSVDDGGDTVETEPSAESIEAAKAAMSIGQKKALLKKVLRSPQFHQSLGSLSMAIRDGGLPMVADALKVNVENGGLVRGGTMPLGGGEAVEAFVEGVKKSIQQKK